MIGSLTVKPLLIAIGLLAASLAGLGLAYWLQSVVLKSCRVDNDRAAVDVARLEGEKSRLLLTIKDQNAAVAKLKQAADEKASEAAQALASARASAAKY